MINLQDRPLTNLQDRPVESADADLLNRNDFVENLCRTLLVESREEDGTVSSRKSTGYVVGLTGPWGSGKSTILNLVYEKLKQTDDVIVARFNPWLFRGRDELVSGFFNALRGAIGESTGEKAVELLPAMTRYWGVIDLAGKGITAAIDIHTGGGSSAWWRKWSANLKKAIPDRKTSTPDQERINFEKKIVDSKSAVVVLIDELDRIEDDEIRAVAQLVKALGDIKGISYLVSYDRKRVTLALGQGQGDERRKSGEHYLEKIIQHPIPIRPLFFHEVEIFLKNLLEENADDFENNQDESCAKLFLILCRMIETPRDAKRLTGAYKVLSQIMNGDICSFDLLAYCWLLIKRPEIISRIREKFNSFVFNPNISEYTGREILRAHEMSSVEEIFGDIGLDYAELIATLFPKFTSSFVTENGHRLSRRRNLVRVLYLGNPPNTLNREQTEKIWEIKSCDELLSVLETMIADGRLTQLLDRVDDLMSVLSERYDENFWKTLCLALRKCSTDSKHYEAYLDFLNYAKLIKLDLRNRDDRFVSRYHRIIDNLIDERDIILLPSILRQTRLPRNVKDTYFNIQIRLPQHPRAIPIKNLLSEYKNLVQNGTALSTLPSYDLFMLLFEIGQWDAEAREFLTGQLTSTVAMEKFSALFFFPGSEM